jgi:CTP synthase
VDAGTMNPTEHGEVFVLDSGLETDQDMGNYERFTGNNSLTEDYITSGMVYYDVIKKERNLEFDGRCVEAVPDIVNEIEKRFRDAERNGRSDITVIEIGGTIGDYQNILFMEAARLLKIERPKDVVFVLVSYVPIPGMIGEQKTRPTRIAARTLNSYGIQTDFIVARSELPIDKKRREKLATSCSVNVEHVISAPDIESIYDVPINFEKDGFSRKIIESLSLKTNKKDLKEWRSFVRKTKRYKDKVKIAIVGKYFDTGDFVLSDSYISVIEAIKFSAFTQGVKADISWINSKDYEKKDKRRLAKLKEFDGIIVPGGFGKTGVEGKINVIQFARENKIPYFGLCYGMQLAVVEFARNVAKVKGAHTIEIDPKAEASIIDIMPEQKEKLSKKEYGGTMRLGAWPAKLKDGTIARGAYKSREISERHRHRYEVNPEFIETLEKAGLVFSGTSPDGRLMEIAELPKNNHPFFLGTQFHPEFNARPLSPHPLFDAFIKAAKTKKS